MQLQKSASYQQR
jgi:RNA recognition motif-containing protein